MDTPTSRTPLTIIVVEDNPVDVYLIRWVLKAHELAHEMLHHRKEESPLPKMVRETQAEAVAFVVSRGVGL